MQGVSQPACWHSSELVFESSRFYQRFPQVDLLSELELKLLGGARINTGAFTHETPVQWLLSRRGVDGGVELVKSGRGRSFGRQPPPHHVDKSKSLMPASRLVGVLGKSAKRLAPGACDRNELDTVLPDIG